ncbi:hypothetical protein QTO34_017188 [Cnephaeus nilssonii]|uniref:Small ribosomal subunit protein uS5 C-terminal domain-containing protein n=1 Tax=Cnephaeus nilssonii TaxID=3371016 RepID=A0AA40I0I8_CNENI|nr:hypothetical protein QTO34_017188 [Eptesicus nilssonii]
MGLRSFTKVGCFVKDMKIKSLELYLFSQPNKESEIIDFFWGKPSRTQFWKPVIEDVYTLARGCTAALGNFAKATFDIISKTYSYLTPSLWKEVMFTKSPYQEFTDHLHLVKTTPELLCREPRLQL